MDAVKTESENMSNIYRESEIMRARFFLLSLIITVSSSYCYAQEKVVIEPVLESLRQQMKQLDTLKADYTVNTITYPSNNEIRYEVSYIKSGDKYNLSEYAYQDNEQVWERRYVYDGIDVKYFELVKKKNIKEGSIFPKSFNSIGIDNNIYQLAGFGIISSNYEKNIDHGVYKNMGKEIINGHECTKILTIMPYKPQKDAYHYHYIEKRDNKYFLIKNICLIEDDPDQLLFQKQYDFDYSYAYPLPRKINYERFEIDDNGIRTPEYKTNVIIKDFEVNIPVSDSEFVYFFPEGTMVNTTTASETLETIFDPNRGNEATLLQRVTEVNQPAIDNRTEFPFGDGSEAVLLPVHIQGHEYLFLLDTGSSATMFDASLRDLLGTPIHKITGQSPGNPFVMQIFESPLIQIGPFILPQGSEIGCLDMSMLSMVDGREISGILGMDFLKNHVIQINFDKGIISFFEMDDFDMSASGQKYDLTYNSVRVPIIRGQLLDSINTEFVIDSGNNYFGNLDKDTFEKLVNRKDIKITEVLAATASGSQMQREIRAKVLKIGDLSYKDIIFGEGNYNCLGLGFLNRHIVTFDFPKMKMYLNKSDQFERIDEDDMSGLHLLRISDKTVVHSIDKGSSADKNSITSGDIILKINGQKTENIEITKVRSILKSGDGKEIPLTVEHNGQSSEIILVLERKI